MGSKLEEHEIVPDVIPIAPQDTVTVDYPSGVNVSLGNELTPTQVKDKPTVTFKADPNSFYTLSMVDPDAPSRAEPSKREVNHWLVVNIPGNQVSQGETLWEYRGSGPPLGTGLHRYIFLVFKQPGKLTFEETYVPNTSRRGRLNFKITAFAAKYNLGNAIAGNFYQAQYDDYVPIAAAQVTEN